MEKVLSWLGEPKILKEFDGGLELTERWVRYVLLNIDWVKGRVTVGKDEPRAKFLQKDFSVSVFLELFDSIGEIFILGGRLGGSRL